MPLFMDMHNSVEGATREAVAGAYQKDLDIQAQYGVKYRTYWHDQSVGRIFCLAEAPNRTRLLKSIAQPTDVADEIFEVTEGS